MSRDQEISSRLAKLTTTERHAVMTEAAVQFGSMDIDGNVLDYLENALDMLGSGEYVERDRVLRHRSEVCSECGGLGCPRCAMTGRA